MNVPRFCCQVFFEQISTNCGWVGVRGTISSTYDSEILRKFCGIVGALPVKKLSDRKTVRQSAVIVQ
ncbi:MAG: hypothetical protein DMF59_18740 [Acidobacteria bacterium]|nr:MAG: hypothetical protein DMF59_18740 [Acidobacteriota bacterium]